MFTRKTALKIVKNYLADCQKAGISIDTAYLFGSVINNSANENSDIDVALVSEKFTNSRIDNRIKLSKINIRYSMIDPHTFSKKYFQKSDTLIDEIKRDGILIN
jgi:uncharacterized protein